MSLKIALAEIWGYSKPQIASRVVDMVGSFGSVVILAQAANQQHKLKILAASGLMTAFGTKTLTLGKQTLRCISSRVHLCENDKIGREIHGGWLYGSLISAIAIPVLLYLTGQTLESLGQESEVIQLTEDFMRSFVWGIPAFLLLHVNHDIAKPDKSRGLIGFILVSQVFQTVALLSLSYLFILSDFAKNHSATFGLGLATTAANGLTFLLSCIYYGFTPKTNNLGLFNLSDSAAYWNDFKSNLKQGSFLALKTAVESGMMLATALMIGATGAASLAAHEIVVHYIRFAIPLYHMVGNVGADRLLIKRTDNETKSKSNLVQTTLLLSEVFVLPFTLLFALLPHLLMRAFIDVDRASNADIISTTKTLLLINGVGLLFDAPRCAISMMLRGFQKNKTDSRDVNLATLNNFIFSFALGLGALGYTLGFVEDKGAAGVTLGRVSGWLMAAMALGAYVKYRFNQVTQDEAAPIIPKP